MDTPYFPYPAYRPHQKEMLTAAANAVTQNKILMVDAPTGSGKSSLICAILGACEKKKIIVAVRSNSQLDIFLNELQKIRSEKAPDLKFSYIYGKSKICPLFDETKDNIYNKCKRVRDRTDSLFLAMYKKRREEKTDTDFADTSPLAWPEYKEELDRQTKTGKIRICPYYANILASYRGFHTNNTPADTKINDLLTIVIRPEKIKDFCGGYCPHKLMWDSLKEARVVILNYHYLLRADIEATLLKNLDREPKDLCLLLDEAHNAGEIVKSIYGRKIAERTLDLAEQELKDLCRPDIPIPGTDALWRMLETLRRAFDARLYDSPESRKKNPLPDWLNPDDINTQAFLSHMAEGNAWQGNITDLLAASSDLMIDLLEQHDYAEFPLYTAYNFVMDLAMIQPGEPYYVYLNKDASTNKITFEKRVLDPGEYISSFVHQYSAAVLCSGTLFPLASYKRYYFSDSDRVVLHSAPNAFPKENRLVLKTADFSSEYARRSTPENVSAGITYIKNFSRIPGNVGVFFTSYAMRDRYLMAVLDDVSRRKKIFSEPQGDDAKAARLIREFMALPKNGGEGMLFGVCGAKWYEGLDFKGEMLNGVMVLGLPLGLIDSYQKRVNAWFTARYGKSEGMFIGYYLPAMNKAVQALGRCLRTREDTGVLVLGDRRYCAPAFKPGLPEWMASEMKPVFSDEFEPLVSAAVEMWHAAKPGDENQEVLVKSCNSS
ncbi:MAG TPA: ATP-dependent DNA helicase [Methanocorpusculum sp.]|nr:ATP-dependent DNA helicase [Methanocorpusculum sp.]